MKELSEKEKLMNNLEKILEKYMVELKYQNKEKSINQLRITIIKIVVRKAFNKVKDYRPMEQNQ